MTGTYAAVLAVGGASLAIGQAALVLCGTRRWSWLAPAVGLALLSAICWGTVRLPGDGAVSAVVVLALTVMAVLFLRGRVAGGGEALRVGVPVGVAALAAASLPFLVEGHFGILGTGFNPDMSQHLLATERLAHGAGSQLLHQGYPLGPHAIVVALGGGLGIAPVQGFSGLAVAVAVLAVLTALTVFAGLPSLWRTAAALLVAFPYLVASYFAQGAFKETMQALLVLAFALSLREASRNSVWRPLPLRFVPAALIAIGSVYVYSFPGLVWLVVTAALWVALEYASGKYAAPAGGAAGGAIPEEASATAGGGGSPAATGPAGLAAMSLAVIVFAVGALPELGRMIDFRGFETFAPHGTGLGNLFGQISPFEALGIWPSGDFRIAPGDGAMPALGYYLGAAFATALLLRGLIWCWRRRETAVIGGFLAATAVYVAARVGGTPYTAAKAIEAAAPLATLVILLPLLDLRFARKPGRLRGVASAGLAAAIYALAAGGCSLLALANAPVGPTSYSPALTEVRPLLASGSTLVLASQRLLDDEHGARYIAWELRGGRVCIEAAERAGTVLPPGVRFVIAEGSSERSPFPNLRRRRLASPYLLWERAGPVRGHSPCPLIAIRQARQGPAR